MKNITIDEKQTLCLITKELNRLSQQNYAEDVLSIIENTKRYHFPYPSSYKSTETEHSQKYIKVVTIRTIGKDHFLYGKALFQYFQKDLGISAETAYTKSNFCNYINAKIDCLLDCTTDTGKLGEQIHQSLLGYLTAMTTQAIAETLHIIDTDIKYYEYENKSNNPITAQAKSMVNKKPRILFPTTPSYYQTSQSRIVFNLLQETQLETLQTPENSHPWNQHNWTKSLGEYGLLFGNLTPAAGQTERNPSTWEQPPAQNLAESASPLIEKTAILQSIGSSNKEKQPALAPREHSNMRTPIPLNITNIAKLEKFSGEKNNAYSWIADTEKAITTLLFFLTGTANSWYQSLAEKPISFTEFKLTFLQYFCDPNTLIQLQNQFSIIKQKDHEVVTTYFGQFNQILHQILAIKRDYYTAVQVLNQFIKGLQSNTITLTCNFEFAEQEASHTQAVNLAINKTSDINAKITQLSEKLTQKIEEFLAGTTGTYQPPQWKENNNNSRYPQQQNYHEPKSRKPIPATQILAKHSTPIFHTSESTASICTTSPVYSTTTPELLSTTTNNTKDIPRDLEPIIVIETVQLELNVLSPIHHSKGNVERKIAFRWEVEKKEAKNEKKLEEIKKALAHETELSETEEWTPDNAQE
ncbi:hypothetical protein G9A89_008234 [Geosiphon pyriformis]|nr:hypothetical protein G9A89_008234 [Geosiphon pyriformis]